MEGFPDCKLNPASKLAKFLQLRYFIHSFKFQGIYIPERDAEWEMDGSVSFEQNLTAQLSCSAKFCICQMSGGRKHHQSDGLWEILPCHSCGLSKGIHVKCGGLEDFVDPEWNCYVCRRVVRDEDVEWDRPIVMVWGRAKGTKSGKVPR